MQTITATTVLAPGVLENDVDTGTCSDGERLTVVTPPKHGSVSLENDGSFVYTPSGTLQFDTFQYQVACLRQPDVYNGVISTAWVVLAPGTGNCNSAAELHEIEAGKLWSWKAPHLQRAWLGEGGPNLIENGVSTSVLLRPGYRLLDFSMLIILLVLQQVQVFVCTCIKHAPGKAFALCVCYVCVLAEMATQRCP